MMTNTTSQNVTDYAIHLSNTYGDLSEPVQEYAVGAHVYTDLLMMMAPLKEPIKGSGLKLSSELAEGTQVAGVSSSAAKRAARRSLAKSYFENAGKSADQISILMETSIDFGRTVREKVFNVGDKVWRFERKSPPSSEMHFFTDAFGADAGPSGVGFSGDHSEYFLHHMKLQKRQ